MIGGTYREQCTRPLVSRLAGSGVRAATVLGALGEPVRLVTAVEDEALAEASAVTRPYGVRLEPTTRPGSVAFGYFTPLDRPRISRYDALDPSLVATDDLVVAFGMIGATWTAEAERLVVDLQHSGLDQGWARSRSRHKALLLNSREARNLTGEPDPARALDALLALSGADVVVVKRGTRGAMVAAGGNRIDVPAHETPTVAPIGSGDAFTAGFAKVWGTGDADPVEAARFASRTAAAYVAAGGVPTPAAVEAPGPTVSDEHGTVYLAAPFFDLGQRWLVQHVYEAMLDLSVDVFSPLHAVGHGGDDVAEKDLAGLRGCRSVLALLDDADPGTLYETGWANANGIPVVGYSQDPALHAWTMLRGTGAEVHDDLSTAVYRAAWAASRPADASPPEPGTGREEPA